MTAALNDPYRRRVPTFGQSWREYAACAYTPHLNGIREARTGATGGPAIMTSDEVAARLNIDKRRVAILVNTNVLRAFKVANRFRIDAESVRQYERDRGPDMFYPDPAQSSEAARQVCAECPVARECLDYAMKTREPHGVWGGVTARERLAMRQAAA